MLKSGEQPQFLGCRSYQCTSKAKNSAGEEQMQGDSEPAGLQYAYHGVFGWHLHMFVYMWLEPTLRNVLVGIRMTLSSNMEASEKPQKQQKVNKYFYWLDIFYFYAPKA